MIIFSITNDITEQTYIGTTKDCATARWKEFKSAVALNIDAPLYRDIRQHGSENFTVCEIAVAEDRQELRDLIEDALSEDFSAINLQGVKTRPPANDLKPAPRKRTAITSKDAVKTTKAAKPKLATGRTTSANKEKAIKEGIAREKAERDALKQHKVDAEAAEMKALMARLDERAGGSKR